MKTMVEMQPDDGDLVVAQGQTVILPARLHRFASIDVASGGIVRVTPNSSRWSMWWVEGDVKIDGVVVGLEFSKINGAVSEKTPDGLQISHTYENAALGGDGGSGGNSAQAGAGSRQGGSGARGDREFGGGGGSGGGIHIQGPSTRLGSNGNDASDWRGAQPASDGGYANRGGDGARAARHSNGGLLSIRANGKISGTGSFLFSGANGAAGQPGASGHSATRGQRGGSGGGGGAPGGDGGYVLLVANELSHSLRYEAQGGAGGVGGLPGGNPRGATAGRPGDPGSAGTFDEYTLGDWPH